MSAKPVPAPFPLEREHRLACGRGELTLGSTPSDVVVLRIEVCGVPLHGIRTEAILWRRGDTWRLGLFSTNETGRMVAADNREVATDERLALEAYGMAVAALREKHAELYPGAAAEAAALEAARAGYREDREEAG